MLSKVQGFQTLRLNNNENSSAKNKDIISSLVLNYLLKCDICLRRRGRIKGKRRPKDTALSL